MKHTKDNVQLREFKSSGHFFIAAVKRFLAHVKVNFQKGKRVFWGKNVQNIRGGMF
ncbi:hypothetical protein JHK87_046157 [Glycine soja]|nr:hypothetical protein JHK87_046157 [Glycine soja]